MWSTHVVLCTFLIKFGRDKCVWDIVLKFDSWIIIKGEL